MRDVTFKGLTEQDVVALSEHYGEPDWLRDRRLEAFKAFSDLEWPHRKMEDWRHTNPSRIDNERPVATEAGEAPGRSRLLTNAGELAGNAIVVDGAVVAADVEADAAAQGVVVADLSTAAAGDQAAVVREHLGTVVGTDTTYEALALAAFTGSVLVHVPANVAVAEPIAVTIHATAEQAFVPRVLVVLGTHAEAKVYIDHTGTGASTVVGAVEVVVGDGARADVVTAQDWGDAVDHVATHKGRALRDATYRHLEVTLGGKTVYLRPDVRLDGEGAAGELLGVYFTDEGQHFHHRSLIHHNASHTTSHSVYKGALQGRSNAVWYGNIRIEPHAKGTTSDETNRNLVLSDGARADTIPWLEILTSDVVGCGHHSSVGQLDEQHLFYLESRGIPRAHAVRMLVYGFFSEVTDRIDMPGVTQTVIAEIEEEIEHGDLALMDPRRST